MATAAVLTMALIVLAQSLSLCYGIYRLMESMKRAEKTFAWTTGHARRSLQEVGVAAARLNHALENLSEAEISLDRSLQKLVASARGADRGLERFTGWARDCLEDVRQGSDTVLGRFSRQTYRVHRAIIDPAMRLSALCRAAVEGLRQLILRSDPPYSHSGDKQIFI